MNKRHDVAQILRNKPQGTELYDLARGIVVRLDAISTTDGKTVIWCTGVEADGTFHYSYSEFGTLCDYPDGIVILVPDKEQQSWEEYSRGKELEEYDDGEILYAQITHEWVFIYHRTEDGLKTTYYAATRLKDNEITGNGTLARNSDIKELRPATDSERQQLFNALATIGKRWNPDAKRVEELRHNFKPFDRVLVRDREEEPWRASFYSHLEEKCSYAHNCGDTRYRYCIPYEGNEELVGTTKNP